MIRKPAVAGQFYDSRKEELLNSIETCFNSELGPRKIPIKCDANKPIQAAIMPHAGYVYSGMCAAHGYYYISERGIPDIFILIGLSHSGHPSCVSKADWQTPLGVVKNAAKVTESISKNSNIPVNENAHATEHSIEVQIPFLQYIAGIAQKDIQIVPVMIGPDTNLLGIAKGITKTIKEIRKQNKTVTLIVSSDFTHFGYRFGFAPFNTKIRENIEKLDFGAIKLIQHIDAKGFAEYIEKTGATICGERPIQVLLNILDKSTKSKVLKYYPSSDIVNDSTSSVSYACIVFEEY